MSSTEDGSGNSVTGIKVTNLGGLFLSKSDLSKLGGVSSDSSVPSSKISPVSASSAGINKSDLDSRISNEASLSGMQRDVLVGLHGIRSGRDVLEMFGDQQTCDVLCDKVSALVSESSNRPDQFIAGNSQFFNIAVDVILPSTLSSSVDNKSKVAAFSIALKGLETKLRGAKVVSKENARVVDEKSGKGNVSPSPGPWHKRYNERNRSAGTEIS